ncbi:MAG: DUF342 domain-containing protein [Phycisphaeraceae bacterium]|nr:DUF342 domain-containing protein [Phycisphaeraceae bacterium]
MPSDPHNPDLLQVIVSTDKLTAELLIPADPDPNQLTRPHLDKMLEEAEVKLTDEVARKLDALLAAPRTPGKAGSGIIAQGAAPRHGTDGTVEWTIDKWHEKQIARSNSHYDRSAFIMVEADQKLGRLIAPDPGQDGCDVAGKPIPARPGKPALLRLDDTIRADEQGNLIANVPGLFARKDRTARIQQVLQINDGVDFSTGNIEFAGSVVVNRGVKDCFFIKASGDVEVRGLVEAASLEAGGDVIVAGGFAGREQGKASVGGNLRGRYLDGVTAEVRRDLMIDREIINCQIVVHGGVSMKSGSIIGGHLTVTGPVHVANLGSNGGVQTNIVVGTVPRLEPLLLQLQVLIEKVRKQHRVLNEELEAIKRMPARDRKSDANRQRIQRVAGELPAAQELLDKTQAALEAVERKIESLRVVDVQVEKMLHAGVIFHFDKRSYRIKDAHPGPIRIRVDREGVPVYRTTASGGPLVEISEPFTRKAA